MTVVLAAAIPGPAQSTQKAVPPSYTVAGRVTDFVSQNGIEAVTIEAVDSQKHHYATLTGKDGSYKLEGLPSERKLTLRCHQLGYSPNPTEAEINLKNGTATWDVHLFLASADKDYLKDAAARLTSMRGTDRITEAKFVAENAGQEGQRFIAQELRKRLHDTSPDSATMELAKIFHFEQLPPDQQPVNRPSPQIVAEQTPLPTVEPDSPADTAQASEPSFSTTALNQILQTAYTPTKATADQSDIVTAGSVLVLKQDNLAMVSVQSAITPINVYRGGKISQPPPTPLSNLPNKLPGHMSPLDNTRIFVRGEKFWVTSIDVQNDYVIFHLLSDPIADVRFKAALKFPLLMGSNKSTRQVVETVAEVLGVDPEREFDAKRSAEVPAQAAPPLPPPTDAPPAPPATVAVGQTIEQVVAAFGKPTKSAEIGSKTIYLYSDMKVTFVKGKVTDVQ